ncbi:GFA family protein [Chelativorans intermedius]|uniref:GFA family protein n=1 Tax=Chelativorans intermedius TaxID=515947 RepID=A0ABV6D984_9HYPH|nr:GFA family protein [Chelativorans intermedius]MCT8999979.1 GFA family protein [Chelativorans intermedius]
MKKTRHGSCHCGAVRFCADLDLGDGTSRCNCSICAKGRFWKAIVADADFQLLSGQEMLSEYRFGSNSIAHLFCRTCGIKPFGRGRLEELGGTFYAINVACLDDATPEELASAPVAFEDGLNDAWDRVPAETRHL